MIENINVINSLEINWETREVKLLRQRIESDRYVEELSNTAEYTVSITESNKRSGRAGIMTKEQLINLSVAELIAIKNIGVKSINEILNMQLLLGKTELIEQGTTIQDIKRIVETATLKRKAALLLNSNNKNK